MQRDGRGRRGEGGMGSPDRVKDARSIGPSISPSVGRPLAPSPRLPVQSREQGLANPPVAVHKFVPVPAPVAQEVAVHLAVVAVVYAAQLAVPLAGDRVAAKAAVHADGGRGLQIPFARVVLLQG